MTIRTVLLHLRVPFSFFLLPIFWFALSQSPHPDVWRVVMVGLVIHLLLYPASNAYNSYFDKDEGPIGGLATPPPVTKELYWVSLLIDAVALGLGALVGWPFVLYLLVYGFITKAYSHNRIRLKKFPVFSWLLISGLQGGITYVMTYVAINQLPLSVVAQPQLVFGGLLGVLNLMALYPVTQVYQHDEDARRGDRTLSLLLGVRGTFVCAIIMFGLSLAAFFVYFKGSSYFMLYALFLLPAMLLFLHWTWRVWQNERFADYQRTMRMMWTSGVCLNSFFLTLVFLTRS